MYSRYLDLSKLLKAKSYFLLGPRATGKTSLVRSQLKKAQIFDLLNSDVYDRFIRRPEALAEEITSNLVVIDEIQKIPRLLDVVHRLIEERKIIFLLTGSSARKLKRGGANLLAGRARSIQLFPLTQNEITDFDLLKYCRYGGLPIVYNSDNPWLDLKQYVQMYLHEEILAEALVRKVDHFARFLDVFGLQSGEELNYEKIASDAAVPARTVANFVEILKDTLLAFEMTSYKTKKRKAVSRSKIYLFDVGIANYLSGRKNILQKSEAFGKAFEHFILQEIRAALVYQQKDHDMFYWRTQNAEFEVDCIIGDQLAIEIKSSETFSMSHLKGLKALAEERKIKKLILINCSKVESKVDGIQIVPYQKFLQLLWSNKLIF